MGLPDTAPDTNDALTSGVLPIICHLIAAEPGCQVVDLGATSTDNCTLFSLNRTRVYIDTSRDNLRARVIESGDLDSDEVDRFLQQLPDAIDVILFWDLLDYLPLETIKEFMKDVSGLMQPGGLAYILASRQRYISSAPAIIDVVQEDTLRFHYDAPFNKEAPQYAPKKLEQYMPGFVLEKLYLLQNGVQEHLFVFEGLD